MALKTMIEQLRTSQTQFNIEARTRIAAELGKLLPEGSELTWRQYTDYFNDGEPCTFSVHEPYLVVEDAMKKHRIDVMYDRKRYAGIVSESALSEIADAWKAISNSEDLLQSAFGDHIEVTVYPDGRCETENCDHE